MDIKEAIINAGIKCYNARCVSRTGYVCENTTPEKVDTILKSIGVYPEYRAFWSSDSIWDRDKAVYINKMYTNGKSWD